MRTLRLTIAYEGTDFHGWQYQPRLPTVQGLVMSAAGRVLGAPVKVTGASRTDAGVHALRQVASLTTASAIAPGALARALNALLPPAIRVLGACEAAPGFDARRSACGKRYAYVIDRGGPRRSIWSPVRLAYCPSARRAGDGGGAPARAGPARLLGILCRRGAGPHAHVHGAGDARW
jgi:tRNA pseudouridine(38-40) synthase